MSACSIPECGKTAHCRGWCKMHYTRRLRKGTFERKGRRIGVCSIEGCESPIRNRGWCLRHYERWRRHGNPESGRIAAGEAQRYLATTVLPFDGDDCLIWPYAKDQDGYARIGKRIVTRIVCEFANGPPPVAGHQATHSCGNGHLACVSKRHLRWKSPAGNSSDMVEHGNSRRGEKHHQVVLSEETVKAIRSLQGELSQRELGEKFGVSQGAIWRIHNRKTWAWLD